MKRSELAHILRSACRITGDPDILVIGSQSILGKFSHAALPDEAWLSVEADIAFFDDPDESKADEIDGKIGEASPFHDSFGVYGQGVSLTTATLANGWRDRLVPFTHGDVGESRAMCLDPHDLVVSKLVANREKDIEFAGAVIAARLVDVERLIELVDELPTPEAVRRRVRATITKIASITPKLAATQQKPGAGNLAPARRTDRVPKGTPHGGRFRARRGDPDDAGLQGEDG